MGFRIKDNGESLDYSFKARETSDAKGKSKIHQNVYGNWNGYRGGKKVIEFGSAFGADKEAEEWLSQQA